MPCRKMSNEEAQKSRKKNREIIIKKILKVLKQKNMGFSFV